MRIVSNFKDYYDCIQGMGQDQSVVYIRKTEEIERGYPFRTLRSWSYYGNKIRINHYTVGFCGKVYPLLKVTDVVENAQQPEAFCYTASNVNEFIESNYKEKEIEAYYNNKAYFYYKSPFPLKCKTVKEYFEEYAKSQNVYQYMFEKYNCPIFLAKYGRTYLNTKNFIINPRLNEYEFFRVLDPYTAFQELFMWMSNQAQPRKEIPEISDEIMRSIKGFDDKYCFKQEPGKKRRKKKA